MLMQYKKSYCRGISLDAGRFIFFVIKNGFYTSGFIVYSILRRIRAYENQKSDLYAA